MNLYTKPFSKAQNQLFKNAQILNTDLVEISYVSACCSVCGKYRGRIFSISGRDERFPKLPDDFHEDCGLMAFPFIYGVQEPQYCKSKDILAYNNRPFRDTRTAEEKANYKLELQAQEEEHQKEQDKIDYDWMREHLPEICPKTFGAYRRMKNLNSANYQKLITEVYNKGYNFRCKGSKTMYCKNCGQPVSENSAFCANCGSPQQSAVHAPQPQQSSTYQQPQTTNYASENNTPKAEKWYKNTLVIVFLLVFFFPVGLFLMWKFTDWKKSFKIIISIVIALFVLGVIFIDSEPSESDYAESTGTSAVSTTEQAPKTTLSQQDKDIAALTSISNLTADEAKEILKDLESVGFENIESAEINGSQSDADSGVSFTVSYNGYSAILIVIERKTDYISSGDITLFKNGKAIDNINNYTLSDYEKITFINRAEEQVKRGLKSPSSAEFPGTVLEIGEWNISRNKDVVTVISYVDSQNGFGAMIRSKFAVQLSYSSSELLYLEIDGTALYGKPQ